MIYTERNSYLNCEKRIFPGAGKYEIPTLEPVDVDLSGCEAIGFNCVLTCNKPENKVVHFHLDDHEFERVWNNPSKYVPILRKFRAVLAPDFSTYEDFPIAVRIFNSYRKAWVAAYWQENGIKVIPVLDWSTNPKHTWFFHGIPHYSLVSVSTIGGFKNKYQKELWLEGFKRALKIVKPTKLLIFGKLHPEIKAILSNMVDCEITTLDNKNLLRKSTLSKSIEVVNV